jgi:tRNA nucleotidyltransferase (CCA-adding enzyme)
MNFIKAMTKVGKEKCIIDIEKQYEKKKNVLIDLNSSKLHSPIILIDPTYKQRNALAALSQEVYEKFQRVCKKFIKNPSIKYFEIKKVDIEKIKEESIKNNREFILIEARTNKQEGDIAGSKLLKFYNYIEKEINRFFVIKNKGFNYNNKQSARYFFVAEKKKEIIYSGPFSNDERNVQNFKKEHKNVYEKKGRLYAKERVKFSLEEFLERWKIKNAKIIKEMYIPNLNYIK